MENTQRARTLRQRSTETEHRLWRVLRNRQISGCKFRRQHPVGPYIADFACPERKLIVELDGGQHADAAAYDSKRTTDLEREGYRVLRFWNNEVLSNLEGVVRVIEASLNVKRAPHPGPLPGGERE